VIIAMPSGQLRKPMKANRGVGPNVFGSGRPAIDIKLENPWNHDDRLWTVPILEHCELKGLCSIDEKPTAEPVLILHDPMAVAVLADAEQA
jgi:hypothetical protein